MHPYPIGIDWEGLKGISESYEHLSLLETQRLYSFRVNDNASIEREAVQYNKIHSLTIYSYRLMREMKCLFTIFSE